MWNDYGMENSDNVNTPVAPRLPVPVTKNEFARRIRVDIDDVYCDVDAVKVIDEALRALRGRIRIGRPWQETPLGNALESALYGLVERFDLAGTPGHYAGLDRVAMSATTYLAHDGIYLADPMALTIHSRR